MRTALGLAALAVTASTCIASAGASGAAATKIVYHSKVHGNNEILVVSSAGGVPNRLTRSPASDSNPTWSADGRRIAFESNRRNPRRPYDADIYVMRADGSHVRELTFANGFDGDPAWASTNRIAFESDRDGNRNIWTINSDGTDESRLTTSVAPDMDPAWSPDGSRIAFTSERDGGDREIYVMNADGTSQTRLTNHPALDALPSWSKDSRSIVFVSDRIGKGQRRLYVVNADGTGVRMLTRGAFDMSPDWATG